MVSFYRAGHSLREVAKTFNESKSSVQRWVKFAEGQRLERVDFYNKKTGTGSPFNKSSKRLERQVLTIRQHLKAKSILGLYGSEMIHSEMVRRGMSDVPTSRTIANIIKRYGLVDRRVRVRHPSPLLVGICTTL
jgi:transposase